MSKKKKAKPKSLQKYEMKVVKKETIKVVKSSYIPSKAELEMKISVPEGLEGASFDDVVSAAIRPVNVVRTDKPK